FSLEGKRILITGASSGIGMATAISCAKMGATCVITGRDGERLAATRDALAPGDHAVISADILVHEQRVALADGCGQINGVGHSAGATGLVPVRMGTEKHLKAVYALNFEAPFLLTQQLLSKRRIQNDGSLVFIASLAATIGQPAVGAYSAMKAATIATARCL